MNIKDHSNGKYQVHLYADGNLVVRRSSDDLLVGAVGTTEPRTPAPQPPPPVEPQPAPDPVTPPAPDPVTHPDPIWGELRAVDPRSETAHYADDEGELLPVGFTWFSALDQRRQDPAGFRRTLDAASAAGYQFARVLFAVATPPGEYWDGHELRPTDADYDELVAGLGRDFAAAGMQVFVSSGGLYDVFHGDLDACADWSRHLGSLLARTGVRVAFVDVNESWQNWVTGSEPAPTDIDQYVTGPFSETYGDDFIPLRSSQPGDEITELFNAWSAGHVIQKHGHRGDYPQDHTSAVRHSRGIFYDEQGAVSVPTVKLGIESEPVGPGASVSTLDDPEALALLAAGSRTSSTAARACAGGWGQSKTSPGSRQCRARRTTCRETYIAPSTRSRTAGTRPLRLRTGWASRQITAWTPC